MVGELVAKQEAIKAKERLIKEEEEKKKTKEAEEKALRKQKERQVFEERLSSIVGSKINDACELFLGRADNLKSVDRDRRTRVNDDLEKTRLEKQVDMLRKEYECIRKQMEELTRSVGQAGLKRAGSNVCIASPLEAPARGRARTMGTSNPSTQDFHKLLKAVNDTKEEKRLAEMEVQALRDRFERAVSKLVRQGRTPWSNLAKRMNEATDDDDDEHDQAAHQEEGLDDLTIRPSPPKHTSVRLARKMAVAEREDFVKETKKYIKRLRKHGLQIICGKEGISFVTCEQAINDIVELRASLAFDQRRPIPDNKANDVVPDSEAEDLHGETDLGPGIDGTQQVDVEDDDNIREG
ncbi:hypothetical protein CBR_g10992 [Chara braunii]|uniref:Uncharacterized protein n=1 Tax=Chara braunii TaxID=69332 RepID=A0A388KPV0_CHABU|nr:hypothetical protein CBR_g10992 [Chara braunii]|eukprot:GBG72057.1 hypothetical protein CBR_g10992 [Chara braunii]